MKILEEDFVNRELAWWGIPGVAIGVVQAGADADRTTGHAKVLLAKGYGLRDVEAGLPMTPDTLGGIASCSKAFTAAAAAALVDEGMLDFDRPIREYLPDFKLMDEFATKECTFRDIFCHRTGIAGHDAMWPQDPGHWTRDDFYRRAQYLRPNKPFRSVAQYSNTMYDLAGCILEKISGEKFEDLVRTRILKPLGMRRTCLSLREMQADPDWAAGYFGEDVGPGADDNDKEPVVLTESAKERIYHGSLRRMDGWEMAEIGNPAAGVNSCVTDMLNWVTLHLCDGMYEGRQLFSKKVMQEMHTPIVNMEAFPWVFPEVPGFGLYGMAWKTAVYRGMIMRYHCGEIEGYSSITMFLPAQGFGMFVLCNRHTMVTPFLLEMVYTAIDNVLGLASVDWAARLHPYAHVFEGSCESWKKDLTDPTWKQVQEQNTIPLNHALPNIGSAAKTDMPVPPNSQIQEVRKKAAAYAGIYENPAYGCLRISSGRPEKSIGIPYMRDGLEPSPVDLYLHFKDWILPLEWMGSTDTFLLHNLKEDTLLCTTQIAFESSQDGTISSFSIQLDQTLPPEIFRKL